MIRKVDNSEIPTLENVIVNIKDTSTTDFESLKK